MGSASPRPPNLTKHSPKQTTMPKLVVFMIYEYVKESLVILGVWVSSSWRESSHMLIIYVLHRVATSPINICRKSSWAPHKAIDFIVSILYIIFPASAQALDMVASMWTHNDFSLQDSNIVSASNYFQSYKILRKHSPKSKFFRSILEVPSPTKIAKQQLLRFESLILIEVLPAQERLAAWNMDQSNFLSCF